MEKNTQILIVATVVLVTAFAGYYFMKMGSGDDAEYGNVSVEEAKDLIDSNPGLVILDVRTEAEFNDGHIEAAINIPVDDLGGRLSELNKGDELLVYCRTGNRSTTAVGILEDNGYTRLYHMDGGITDWTREGYPTVN